MFINDWKSYDLPPGQETEWGMIYSTALFHQMHCLGQIRKYTWSLLESIELNDTDYQQGMMDMLVGRDGGDHLHHCFDYLRQSIQCSGDMSMEWPRTEPDGRRIAVDGWGIPHECKDWVSTHQPSTSHSLTRSSPKSCSTWTGTTSTSLAMTKLLHTNSVDDEKGRHTDI